MRPIDADAVLDILRNFDRQHADLENGSEDFVYGVETAIEVIEDAPTIEERKTGIWLPRNSAFQKWFRCSECAYRLYELKGTKFCPNCGADMRG